MRFKNSCQDERGAALVIGLMFLAILALLGSTAVVLTTTDMRIGANYKASSQSFADANAGLDFATATMEAGLKAKTFVLPTTVGGTSALTYTVPSGFSFVISGITMLGTNVYSFTSTGSGPNNAEAVVIATFSLTGPFNYGVFGDIGAAISGNGKIDSYNSSVGPYTWATHSTNGDVGTNATGAGVISLSGNTLVYGDVEVGVEGDPDTGITTMGNAAVIGQKLAEDEPKDMTPLTLPGGGASIGAWNSGTLNSGTYSLSGIGISGHAVGQINGDVILSVTGNITISGHGQLLILAGGSLTIYVSGNVIISGNGGIINNTFHPENLQIYGTSTCASIAISGNSDIYGAIHAPKAAVAISGNGDIYGSVIGRSVSISGNGNIHYDEVLRNVGLSSDLKLLSWKQES